jgi:hypothetical protein
MRGSNSSQCLCLHFSSRLLSASSWQATMLPLSLCSPYVYLQRGLCGGSEHTAAYSCGRKGAAEGIRYPLPVVYTSSALLCISYFFACLLCFVSHIRQVEVRNYLGEAVQRFCVPLRMRTLLVTHLFLSRWKPRTTFLTKNVPRIQTP